MDPRHDRFERWYHEVEALLTGTYCLTIEDTGPSETDLRRHLANEPDPYTFVRWFAEKYDLSENRVY
jgi:hypothetical protein